NAVAASGTAPGAVGNDSGRMLTIAVVMLVAFAGGVMFLDSRLSRLESAMNKTAVDVGARQKADSDALQALSIKADGFAGRADVDVLAKKTDEFGATLASLSEAAAQRQKVLEQEVGALRTQVREAAGAVVDYRPLFEDLRQRHTRAMAAIEGMRSEVAAVPASVVPAPPSG